MKKLLSLLMLLALVLALAGCDSVPGVSSAGEPASGGNSSGAGGSAGTSGAGSGDVYPEDGYATGYMGDTMHNVFFDYTVNSAVVCQEFHGYTPAEGNELLVADVTVKNTTTETITMYDSDLQAQWNDDAEDAYALPITYIDGTNSLDPVSDDQFPGEYDLKIQEERTGLLVYEVPAGNDDFSISYVEYFSDDTEGDTFFVYFTAERDSTAA